MKNWDAEQWVKFLLGATIFIFLNTYVVGAFVLNQKTDEINLQLRIRIIDLLTLIVMKLLVDKTVTDNDKKDKEKKE